MEPLLKPHSFWGIFTLVVLRYVLLAAIAFFFFYTIKNNTWFSKKIQRAFPRRKDYLREIGYSVSTAFIFAAVGYMVFHPSFRQYTQIYTDLNDHSLWYFAFSLALTFIIHDTYFYWTHRFMHLPKVYKLVHRAHHLSTNPSPWAAMAFHPIEAVIEAAVIVLIAVLFPVHRLTIALFLLGMMAYNVYGHLGYELYPRSFAKSRIGKWINTSVSHNQHHQYFKGNYGLYFLWWDRWMGTMRDDYAIEFDEVKKLSVN
jgi:Delta7-sterol 5-desaturase